MSQKNAGALATTGFSREFSVGGWRVRPALNQMELGNEVRRIEGRAMAVFIELAEGRGQLCSKKRLMQAVWGEAFVGDEVLTHAISELRKALGDNARRPRFIQTVPKKGYRLLEPVLWDGLTASASAQFPYRIFETIGGGGMGVVYRAEDIRLQREVAVKFLPPNLVSDAKAKARLLREAQAAAVLEHRNVATIYDVGEDPQGQTFIAMAYYSGETLRERIAGEPLTIEHVCHYGGQIAEGLAAAHAKDVIHRDIKPENIIIAENDEIKIVDFGLAKVSSDSGLTLTDAGATPGTILYMSPESFRGQRVDHRCDLWSLGVVLYEMLLGHPPFSGSSTPIAMHAILESNAVMPSTLRPETPAALEDLISQLLSKDPAGRVDSGGVVARKLSQLTVEVSGRQAGRRKTKLREHLLTRLAVGAKRTWRRHAKSWLYAGVGALAASLVWLSFQDRPARHQPLTQAFAFDLTLPPGVAFAEGADSSAAVSRDGKSVVLIGADEDGKRSVWTLSLDGRSASQLPGAQRPGQPFWSPDGRSIGFFDSNRLYVQTLSGGPPRQMAKVSSEFRGGSWGKGGTILFSPGTQKGIMLVRERDGGLERLTTPDHSSQEIGHLWPHFLPDDQHFLYFVSSNDESIRGAYLASLEKPEGRRILQTSASAAYANGHLLYIDKSSLMARPFDYQRATFEGPAFLLADGAASFFTYQGVFSSSANGVLVYSKEDPTEVTELRWFDRSGRTLGTLAEPNVYRNPSMSRDGRYVAVERHEGAIIELLVIEVETGRQRRVADIDSHQPHFPVFAADGEQLIFAVEESGSMDIRRAYTNATEPPDVIYSSKLPIAPTDWTSDGRFILFNERTERGDFDILTLDLDDDGVERILTQLNINDTVGRFSPVGDLVAYLSNESERYEVFIEPFPRTGRRCQVSDEGGFDPQWGTRNEEIFYLSPNGDVMVVEIEGLQPCELTKPEFLFRANVEPPAHSRSHFEVHPDGQRLLVNSTLRNGAVESPVAVVVGWQALSER